MISSCCIFFLFAISSVVQANRFADSLLNILQTKKLPLDKQMGLYYQITESYASNDMKNTYRYGHKGLALAEEANDKLMIAIFYRYICSTYAYKASYDTTYMYMQVQQKIGEELQNEYLLQHVYFGYGNFYARQGIFDKAIESYQKAIDFYHAEDKDDQDKAYLNYYIPIRTYTLTLGNIGECYRRMDNPERAMYYLKQAQDIITKEYMNDHSCISQVYRELGYVHFAQGDMDKALEYQLKVLNLSINQVHESDCKEALIKIYIIKKQYDKALEYAHDCLRLAKSLGDPYIDIIAWNSFANIYRAQGKYKECKLAAMNAWNIDSTSVDTAPISASNLAYANLFLGNRDEAIYFFKKNEELNEKKNSREFQITLANMEVKYETKNKEMRIFVLEREKQLYVWLCIGGVVTFCMFLGILFFRHRLNVEKRRLAEQQIIQLKQEKQLAITQALLDGETAERSRLARDLHDGLGGMLSVVRLYLKEVLNELALIEQDNRFDKAMKMLDESISELRRVAHHMAPESLVRYGLRVSLEDFCRAIPIAHFQYIGGDFRIDNYLEIVIYRCSYELINNALKYAKASNINVQLLIDDNIVALTVRDDGVGFDLNAKSLGTGLKNLEARILVYNGKMNLYSSPDGGTEVTIEIEMP